MDGFGVTLAVNIYQQYWVFEIMKWPILKTR